MKEALIKLKKTFIENPHLSVGLSLTLFPAVCILFVSFVGALIYLGLWCFGTGVFLLINFVESKY